MTRRRIRTRRPSRLVGYAELGGGERKEIVAERTTSINDEGLLVYLVPGRLPADTTTVAFGPLPTGTAVDWVIDDE